MATFVEAGKLIINTANVAYVEKIDARISVYFVGGQPAVLTLGREDADAFTHVLGLDEFTKKPPKKQELFPAVVVEGQSPNRP